MLRTTLRRLTSPSEKVLRRHMSARALQSAPCASLDSPRAGLGNPDPIYTGDGTAMPSNDQNDGPSCHTLDSLVEYLTANVHGTDHREHDVRAVSKEMEKWSPRASEYRKHVSLCPELPTKYTRNLIFGNEHFDCILMCWPAGAVSSIHDHEESSCWVVAVEGTVHEVQFAMPELGTCGELKFKNVAKLSTEGGVTGTYANNEIGIHRVENRTDKLACTLHVYAPPLRRMRIFDEATGRVHAHLAASRSTAAAGDENYHGGGHGSRTFDIDAWNSYHKYFSLLDEGHGDGGHGYKGHGDGENEVGTGDGRSNGRGGGQPMSERHRNTC